MGESGRVVSLSEKLSQFSVCHYQRRVRLAAPQPCISVALVYLED
ncbi:MAG: hypothetical protein AB2739_08530 [Candidatus Thiodiazotropha endolucinida]